MTQINPFKLERYFARYEFSAPYLLSPSDCESLSMSELLSLADNESRGLWENMSLGYTESPGHPLLREEIARLYASINAKDVVVMAPEEGIFIAMQALLSPGDEVIAIHPAFQSLHEVARWMGCQVIPWTLLPEAGRWQLDLQQLESLITAQTRMLVLNFPHNPTGFLPTRSELDAIIAFARRHNLYLFSDEMYRLLEYDPALRLPAVCDLYELGITLSGMSKALSLPGLRIGWLVSRRPDLVERWLRFKDYTTICNSAPSEVLALIGLRARDLIVRRNLGIIQDNLKTAAEFLSRQADLYSWFPPQAGSVAFPRWEGSIPVEQFSQELVERQGVMVVSGSLFDFPGNHFRLGLGRKNLPQALERVERYLAER